MPDIEYAFLADAADAVPGQKFSVLGGGVARLGGPTFPLRHPHLAMVVGLLVGADELGHERDLDFLLLGAEGNEVTAAGARILADGPDDGRDQVVTFSVDLWNLLFPSAGDYSFRIVVDGMEQKRLPLVVEQRTDVPWETGEWEAGVMPPPFPPPTGQA